MHSSIIALLQLATSLLMAAKTSTALPMTSREVIVQIASRAVQLSAQALVVPPPGFAQVSNDGIWPNAKDLRQSLYLDSRSRSVPLGVNLQLLDSYTSFGDLNGDGFDDAVTVVARGAADYELAAMLNQGGVMFNIADVPLGSSLPQIASHEIQNGKFILGTGSSSASYELLGDRLFRE
ncbi:MAG TPA: hypothetical protein VNG29_01545 [Candidatus Paceibacterota bacterium]|nr:hypothetical protein [Candidatus Paceibacterota bacterium]